MLIKENKTIEDWLSWLDSYRDNAIKLGLDKILAIAKMLQLDKFSCPVITVAGTNGKGSTVAVLEAIAIAANLQVGSYTSPHMFSFTERIKINSEPISEQECIESFQSINANIPNEHRLTYFEFATLAALNVFKNHHLDLIILEVGLGGRLDAVNIINNNVSIITSVGLDHCQYLGNTINDIAYEKAGIIKKNSITICGTDNGFNTIKTIANSCNSNIKHLGEDFWVEESKECWAYKSNYRTINNLLITSFPAQNAACAITAIDSLSFDISEQQIRLALANLKIFGRFQIHRKHCEIIFDVAHNPEAAVWLAKKLNSQPVMGKTQVIINICKDKDWQGVIKPFLNLVDCWYTVDLKNSRLLTADQLAKNIKTCTEKPVVSCNGMQYAIRSSLDSSTSIDRIIVFGSFFTVSAALKIFEYEN